MLKPLGDNVVVIMEESEEKTKSGIVLPSNSKEKSQIAKVVAIGNGKIEDGKTVEMNVRINDKIIMNKYAASEIEYEDNQYYILSQKDILAIVE